MRFLFIHSAENGIDAVADGVGGAVASEAVTKHAGLVKLLSARRQEGSNYMRASKCLPGDDGFAHQNQASKDANLVGAQRQLEGVWFGRSWSWSTEPTGQA